MSTDESLGLVVDRTALIENLLNQVVEGFFAPREEARSLFWNVLLDGSVMTLGAKVKVAAAISRELKLKLDKDALHRVLELRNAFAHHASDSHAMLRVGESPESDSVEYRLHILRGSGQLDVKERQAAFAEFNTSFQAARVTLVELLKHIGQNGRQA